MVALSHELRHVEVPVQNLVQESLGERVPLMGLADNQQAITAVKRVCSKKLRCLNRTHRIAIGSLHEIVGDEKQRVEIRIRYIESKLQKGNIYTKAMAPAQFSAERLHIRMQRSSKRSGEPAAEPAQQPDVTATTVAVDDLTVLRTPTVSGHFSAFRAIAA